MGLDSHGSTPFSQRRSQATLWPDSLRLLQVPCASILRKQNKKAFDSLESFCWCGRWDLNPYVIQHTPLKRACLPIPALPHIHFVHQRCNVYIIRNPAGFVNPFFEKSFLRAAGAGGGGPPPPPTTQTTRGFADSRRRRARPPHPGNIQPSLVFSFSLSAASRATSSACRSRCGTGTPSSTAFSKIESDSLTI